MQYLNRHGYLVLPLDEAHKLLCEGRLPKDAVVITVDDGFYSTFKLAQPILLRYAFPATVYVTSYYSHKETPVFRLVVQYVFWKATGKAIDLSGLGLPSSIPGLVCIANPADDPLISQIIRFGESHLDEPGRCKLAAGLAGRAGVDYSKMARDRIMNVMNSREITEMAASGLDVQLHTHRHCLPLDKEGAQREVRQNREYLEPLVGRELRHLCYPSGMWSREHWPWLKEIRVATATTCDAGLNYADTAALGLKRFLDGDKVEHLDFEAEVSGFSELIRRAMSFFDAEDPHSALSADQSLGTTIRARPLPSHSSGAGRSQDKSTDE
jgi:peptidoglycan/xylan/chitin deacetylase (PgdA/CDA1 family)